MQMCRVLTWYRVFLVPVLCVLNMVAYVIANNRDMTRGVLLK